MDDDYRWYLLKLKQHENTIIRAFGHFRDHGIEPILIKGWAAANLYPVGVSRFFSDTDLAVAGRDFENASNLYRTPELETLFIDLHNELRHLDTESWENLFSRSQLIDLDGTDIRVLCPEDHLRLLCVHWLGDGGEHKHKLWDIYYAVHNRPPDFDWGLCLNSVSTVRRRWIICTIGLAHKYLGLEIDDLPFADGARELPSWIVRTVEKEWKSPVRLRALSTCFHDRKLLYEQLRKRLPPNQIQSTIEMEGSFDAGTRIHYQIGGFLKRVPKSVREIYNLFLIRMGWKKP